MSLTCPAAVSGRPAAPRVRRRRSRLGNYPALGKAAAKAIPGAKLVEFPDYGHAPQMTDPEAFDAALIASIAKP